MRRLEDVRIPNLSSSETEQSNHQSRSDTIPVMKMMTTMDVLTSGSF